MRLLMLFLVVLAINFTSCENTTTVSNSVENESTITYVNQDSINKIRRAIKADEKAKQLDALFKEKARKNKYNAAVLIAQRGQIIYENSFGYADFKTKQPLSKNSTFQLSSTSKPLTATAILQLYDQGKLGLDDNVRKFIPDFPYPDITVKMLLTHRSGLSNYIYFGEPYCDDNNCYNGRIFDNNSLLLLIKHVKPVSYYKPNRKFGYCNTNYAVLASIVERISGMSFADYMQQNIFTPLGMHNTWVHTIKTDSSAKYSTIGHDGCGRKKTETYADYVAGDKGIYSTVQDLFLFDQALYGDKLLKKETIELAFTGYSNEHRGKRNYGLGWRITDNGNGNKIVYHNGWWHGYNSIFFRRLEDQTTVIILSNKDNRTIYKIEDVLAILGSSPGKMEIEL